MVDECRERVVPEGVNPGPDVGQAVWVDAIQPSRADRTHPDQARSMQHPQVLRDRRLADLTRVRQFANAALPVAQHVQEPPTGRVTQGVERSCSIRHD